MIMKQNNPGLSGIRVALLYGALLLILGLDADKAQALTNDDCLGCHGDFIQTEIFSATVHGGNGCVSCHKEAGAAKDEHPVPMSPVNCGGCHERVAAVHAQSMHGKAVKKGDKEAPKCHSCHSKHEIFRPTDPRSSTYPLNIPATCGRCHQEGSSMTTTHKMREKNVVDNYTMSIHGKGLYKEGLIVTATCSSCHTNHNVLPAGDPKSSVHRNNVVATCTQCHVGIGQQFDKSVHSPLVTKTDKKLPVCIDCHSDHTIARVDKKDFRLAIARQCGNCHGRYSSTYLETYHGRASMLKGGERLAKCSDCHGSHDIMPVASPESRINKANIVETCSACHPKANAGFATYLTHATHSKEDKDRYPYLFYTFWAMTGLLLGTFAFFGLHTLLWIPRSFIERLKADRKNREKQG